MRVIACRLAKGDDLHVAIRLELCHRAWAWAWALDSTSWVVGSCSILSHRQNRSRVYSLRMRLGVTLHAVLLHFFLGLLIHLALKSYLDILLRIEKLWHLASQLRELHKHLPELHTSLTKLSLSESCMQDTRWCGQEASFRENWPTHHA